MIHSMTGFARLERQISQGRIVWELRSVNHRYLDFSMRLPEDLRALEPELRNIVREQLRRGKVEATLRYHTETAADTALELDNQRLQVLSQALRQVSTKVDSALPVSLDVLKWPGVVREQSPDLAPILHAATELFNEALGQFQQTRRDEGQRLQDFITQRLDAMAELVTTVQERAPQVQQAWRQRLDARLAEFQVDADPGRLEQEAVLVAQRLDVAEELSRLEGHIKEVRQVLKRDEAIGRRLDFLMQELNREANTLSSKSQDETMTRHAVDLKVLIEQLREQVQNAE
ncbi:MAG: YicC family protein [Sinobacteraceae bacterium]|nr:YicC family protein [Nevskiaceae bacterium]